MDRQEIMEHVADWFGIEPDDNGWFDIEDYDWQAGCYLGSGRMFLNLASVVECIESMM